MKNIFIIMLVFCMSVYAQDIIEEVIEEIKRIEEIDSSETNNNINKNYNSIYEAIENDDLEYLKEVISTNNNFNINSKLPDDYENNLGGASLLLYSIYKNSRYIT